ncbi:MAG TPA: hypothetical protein PKA20_14090 [Burkholderiaceae bacterium]|nr:hypothetical protein [Burkholderiaceae bacterium]
MRREDLDLSLPPANLLEDARQDSRREWEHAALRRLFDNLPHPVSLRLTDGGELLFANAAWHQLLEAAGPEADRAEFQLRDADLAVIRTGQPVITEQRLGAGGAERHYVGHSTLVQGGAQLPDMICSVWTDVEDQVAQIRALRGALEAGRTAVRGGPPRLQPPAGMAGAAD